MKKPKRILATIVTMCLCFFLAMFIGSFPINAEADTSLTPKNTAQPVKKMKLISGTPSFNTTTNSDASMNVASRSKKEVILSTPTPSATPSAEVSATPTVTLVPTTTPEPTPTVTSAPTTTPEPTPTVTSAPTTTPEPTSTVTPTPADKKTLMKEKSPYMHDKAIANVTEYVNIRENASSNSTRLGKLYQNGIVTVLGTEGDWTKVKTGTITGYIFSEYLHLDEEALTYGDSIGAYNAVVTVNTLNVRTAPTTDSELVDTLVKGNVFRARLADSNKEWIAIQYDKETVAYVYAQYVTLQCTLKEGVTLEEEAAAAKAAKIEKAHIETIPITYRDAIEVSEEEEYLLATIVAMESEWEPYEGKLAVANVVINRLLSGRWGDSISDVVYAQGQFYGANSGRVEEFQSKGFKDDCYNAAKEALSGKNNIGEFMFFHADHYVEKNDEWQYFDSWHQIDGNVFFDRNW